MKRILITILSLSFLLSACGNSDNQSSLFKSDQTQEAAAIIADANNNLKEIKKIYKANQGRVDELKEAIGSNDGDKIGRVKVIAKELVIQINSGITLAQKASEKIESAEGMNINDKYKEYLYLKRSALKKQMDAFELRRKSAMALSEELDISDAEAFKKAALILKVNEDEFQKRIDEGKDLSQQANQIAKDALKGV